jgi:2-haloacid dehalogenase
MNIIFDFGGVLFDWNPRYLYNKFFDNNPKAVEAFLSKIGFVEWNAQQDRGRTFAQAVAELSEKFPEQADLIRAYDERWEESLGGVIQPTVEILFVLKQLGYPLYALSNWSEEKYRLVRKRYRFLDCFKDIIISGAVRVAKPDPRIFQVLLERIAQPAGECLLIDDSSENIAVARGLGFATIRFESPEQLRAELNRMGLLCDESQCYPTTAC